MAKFARQLWLVAKWLYLHIEEKYSCARTRMTLAFCAWGSRTLTALEEAAREKAVSLGILDQFEENYPPERIYVFAVGLPARMSKNREEPTIADIRLFYPMIRSKRTAYKIRDAWRKVEGFERRHFAREV